MISFSESTLCALARRCLWIAYVWNDHNFEAAHKYAQQEANEHGIKSFKQASDWLRSQPPQRKPLTDELTRAITQCNSWWGIKCKEMLASERETFVAIINDNTDNDGICCADDLLAALDSRASMEKGGE